MVAPRSRIFASDEELGKRDDDHKTLKMSSFNMVHRPAVRKRRILLVILACVGVWAFIHYMPTDLGPIDRHTGLRLTTAQRAYPPPDPYHISSQSPSPHNGPPGTSLTQGDDDENEDDDADEPPRHNYDGPVRFYYLSSTLRAARAAGDSENGNKHVMFAASDLTAAASLVPIACQMATWRRNFVHIALMGRSDLSVENIQQVNGVSPDSCTIFWHDARPDFGLASTDRRMEVSVVGALGYINSFIHPGVVITTDLESEDFFFGRGLQRKLPQVGMTHIQVPKDRPQSLAWLSRLDANSLKAWHSAGIDILVQAPLDSSGSLIRLLKSLAQADYAGFSPPRLTIELPHKIDAATQNFLSRFRWPPAAYAVAGENEQLTVRRRIFEQRASVDEASHRFIESFYPSSPKGPHVLLLSPQVELSPVYFHYLKLHLLEHLYASSSGLEESNIVGISLESPSTYLDGVTPFQRPKAPSKIASDDLDSDNLVPFCWQAPSSNAALYFASKWMEIHSFFMRRHSATRQPSLTSYFQNEPKVVSQKQPAWMEYILQLMQTRGMTMHYPGLHHSSSLSSSDSLATVHNELYQIPEEFAQPVQNLKEANAKPPEDEILTIKDDYLTSHHPDPAQQKILNTESPLVQNLENILPKSPMSDSSTTVRENNALPDTFRLHSSKNTPAVPHLSKLPLLDHLGNELTFEQITQLARAARVNFRSTAGGCSDEKSKKKPVLSPSAADLFCFDDDPDASFEPQRPLFPISSVNTDADADSDDDDDINDEKVRDESDFKVAPDSPPDNDVLSAPQSPQNPPPANNLNPPEIVKEAPLAGADRDETGRVQDSAIGIMPEAVREHNNPAPIAPDPFAEEPIIDTTNDPSVKPASPPGSNSRTDGKAIFPVLDPSKIKAFDEGREAERDVPPNVDS